MIDLRSDILSGPPPEALEALVAAARDPPGFAQGEDRHERALKEHAADLFGFADALFVPTGTMANQIAVRLRCAPGEIVIADAESHVALNERSSTAGLNAAALCTIVGERGHLSPQLVAAMLESVPRSASDRRVGLVWLENTHNQAGGTIMPRGWTAEIAALCKPREIGVHIDGARIWNAAVAQPCPLREIARGADSLALCLGKGIGAPVGALLLGDRAFIAEAARVRKMFGGWWRPVGMLAAAAHAALHGYATRLAADHAHARAFAAALRERLAPLGLAPGEPETNIVMLELGAAERAERVAASLRARGILASPYDRGRIRFVFHAAIGARDAAAAAHAVAAETIACVAPAWAPGETAGRADRGRG
jgi:threonine aldolase